MGADSMMICYLFRTIFTARRKALQALCMAVYAMAYPSVRPSHSDIVSKWANPGGCGLHHRVAQCL